MGTYDPKNPLGGFFGLGGFVPPLPPQKSTLQTLLEPLPPSGSLAPPATNSLGALAALFATPPAPAPTFLGSDPPPALAPPPRPPLADALYARPKPVKRKAFFSFHYDDVMRVNVVRNAWKITHPDNALYRSFYDSSLWESRKLEGPEALKALIRKGVEYTSAVCVLIGSETWLRRWVKYEIARAIIDGRGLLAVHLNSIRHHKSLTAHTRGNNPLDHLGVGKVQETVIGTPRYYLYEKIAVPNGYGGYKFEWYRYQDYTLEVDLPAWMKEPEPGYIRVLSADAAVYDYIAEEGHKNIGSWIDIAASRARR